MIVGAPHPSLLLLLESTAPTRSGCISSSKHASTASAFLLHTQISPSKLLWPRRRSATDAARSSHALAAATVNTFTDAFTQPAAALLIARTLFGCRACRAASRGALTNPGRRRASNPVPSPYSRPPRSARPPRHTTAAGRRGASGVWRAARARRDQIKMPYRGA